MLVQFHRTATIRDMTALIAMPDLLRPDSEAPPEELQRRCPALPLLSRLLARARALPAAADWRSGVQAALHAPARDVPAVRMAARALSPPSADAALCFATPLHLVAGISRVHLSGGIALDAPEQQALAADFNAEFGGPGLALHAVGSGWLLEAPFAHAASDPDPAGLHGQALARAPARDAHERSLRRLGAEAEMWLAAWPGNQARARRGQPPVNGLWLWGGAAAHAVPAFAAPPTEVLSPVAPDPWLAGLAAHGGVPVRVLPQGMPSIAAGSVLVLQAADGAAPVDLEAMESQWLAPAWEALRTGRVAALHLQIGGRGWRLPARWPPHWLRRTRPWWQQVRA